MLCEYVWLGGVSRAQGDLPSPGGIKGNGLAAKKKIKMVRPAGKRLTKKQLEQKRLAFYRTVIVVLALALVAAVVAWYLHPKEPGAGPVYQMQTETVMLYFPEKTDTFLVPVEREIKLGKKEDLHMRALKELAAGPYDDPTHLLPALPAGINILGCDISGTTARVNFNRLTVDLLDETSEAWFYKSVLYTLCSFDDVERVDFLFEGVRIPALPQGTDVSGPRTPGILNLSRESKPVNGQAVDITLYFLDKDGGYLIPVTERIADPNSQDAEIIHAIHRLLDGPSGADKTILSPVFNPGVKLREQEGVVTSGGKLAIALTSADPGKAFATDPEKAYTAMRLTLGTLLEFEKFEVIMNDVKFNGSDDLTKRFNRLPLRNQPNDGPASGGDTKGG